MSGLFKDDMLGGPSGLDLGHGGDLTGGLDDGLASTSGHSPRPPTRTPVHIFQLERARRDKDHAIVRAANAPPPGLQAVLSVLFSKSKPNIVMFPGDGPKPDGVIGQGNFSKFSTTSELSLRGVPIEFKGDMAGNYVFKVSSMGTFTWKLDEMSGSLDSLHDAAGIQLARFRPEGVLSDIKTLEVLVTADVAIMELIIFSAVVTRMYERETVKQVKKGLKVTDIVSTILGS